MAKQIEGINGGFCGRVGTVIGYQWRGKWCMRSYPRHIHDARTPLQLEQRAWFKRAVGFASRLTEVLRTGLRERSKALHLTEGNLFVALNKQCLTLEEGRLKVDYENLVLSDGMVAPVGFGELELTVTEERFRLKVDFEANPLHLPAQGGDKVFLAALCEVRNESILAAPVFRRNGTIAYTLPACWAGSVVHVYGFVQDLHRRGFGEPIPGQRNIGGRHWAGTPTRWRRQSGLRATRAPQASSRHDVRS